ncbi:septum formation initiator family protein [Streptomyces sp. RS10V-4]|uniref:septum formation initiator family protein n=1 Tax=Streptomyces rhizoryzae TaxID=2932493 RepID=UPI002006B929|nr:septum formation initiator family protein [Streptomyces rhizoryzae]MCK7622123.1 septum formation initiator family protein [Streptomyces rhizoryzae]
MRRQGGRPRGRQRLTALLPSAPRTGTAARTPFVLLVVVLLGSGLIGLLVLNSALNQGSFELSRLERQTGELTDEQQALQQEVDGYSAPGALARRARELGMVPGGNPAFLLPDGTVRGAPGPAPAAGAALSASAGPLPLGPAALRPAAPAVLPPAPAVVPAAPHAPAGPLAPSTPGVPSSPGPLATPAAPASVLTPDAPAPPAPAARAADPSAGPTPPASGR